MSDARNKKGNNDGKTSERLGRWTGLKRLRRSHPRSDQKNAVVDSVAKGFLLGR